MKDGTDLGKEAKAFIDKGALVPDGTMVNLISSELKKLGSEPWLLDGFPRTQAQAAALQKETPVNIVVNLDVPFETIINRVKGIIQIFIKHLGRFNYRKWKIHSSFVLIIQLYFFR